MTPNECWLIFMVACLFVATLLLWFLYDYWKFDASMARDSEKFWRARYDEWTDRAAKNAHEAGKANAKIAAALAALNEED